MYGEHVYEFDDVCVGWRFANMVYEKSKIRRKWWQLRGGREEPGGDEGTTDAADTRTKIDAALLHDIVPQPGGDHEPLNETKNSSSSKNAFMKVVTLGLYSGD